jgi:hypothetical protein
MAKTCPSCKQSIDWSNVNAQFKCPHCQTPLRSNVNAVVGWLIVLSGLPFAVIFALPEWAVAVGLVLGLVVCALIVNRATTIELDRGGNAT